MDDVISTIFLGKINKNIILIRVPSINEKWNLENKIVYCQINELKNNLLYASLKGEENDI